MAGKLLIHDQRTVGEVIAYLRQFDERQAFLSQAILPDGEAWNTPAVMFVVDGSNCGNGLPYLGIQQRCNDEGYPTADATPEGE